MSKPKSKRKKEHNTSFSDKELNIISIFGVLVSGIAYIIYGWPGFIGGAIAGAVLGVFVIRWHREQILQKNKNEINP